MRSDIPHNPGCYLFKSFKGVVLYVGKAKNLKKRVSSYFSKKNHDEKTKALVSHIADVDFIVTNSEVEALILENNLIKKHTPRYNIDLKDSKRYAYVEVTNEEFPRLVLARRREGKGKLFGPFVSAESRDCIIDVLRKTFSLRTCRKMPKRACLRYHIGLCDAPCVGKISRERYAAKVKAVSMILRGKTSELLSLMNRRMVNASSKQNFELALALRNQINALKWLSEKQTMERQKKFDEDILNYVVKDNVVYLMLFNIHNGILENKQEFVFDYNQDFLEEFLVQYYSEHTVPKEIVLPVEVSGSLKDYLEKGRKKRVSVVVPSIGEKKKLLELVLKNIEISNFGDMKKLKELRDKLKLQDFPSIIECFDISHLSGTSTVGSMVQFRNGKADKSNYRRFRIRTVADVDDYMAISEVVRRRYTRLLSEKKRMPDLIVIDGGRGQLNAALSELSRLNIKMPVISIAKQFEEIYVPGLSFPIRLDKKSLALRFLQSVRDEAHRFAIKYNKLLRSKEIKK